MMYTIKVEGAFEAAHRIEGYDGKCSRLHGHNWRIEAAIKGDNLDKLGMLVDFKEAKTALAEVLTLFDHRYLNELPMFSQSVNPTAEQIAKIVFEHLSAHALFQGEAKVVAVTVWETPKSCVTYTEEESQ